MKTMGKKVLVLVLACLMLCTTLTACGDVLSIFGLGKYKIQGTYTSWVANTDIKLATLEFDGDKVTYTFMMTDSVKTGSYELDGTMVTITYEGGGQEVLEYDEGTDELSLANGVLVFKKDKQP